MALEDDDPVTPAEQANATSAGEENGSQRPCPEWAVPRVDDLVIEDDEPVLTVPEWALPRVDDLIIDDGRPVESIYVDRLMRLLTEALYSSWPGPGEGRTFSVFSEVGLFPVPKQTPLVPDVMLSLDVPAGMDRSKEYNSYFVWSFGKPPDVVIEFVSDKRGGEATHKMRKYAAIRVLYYVIYDPKDLLRGGVLRAYHLVHGSYEPLDPRWLPAVGLGLKLWEGEYEGVPDVWLRWCDRAGSLIPTGRERAEQEKQQADEAMQQADMAKQQADEAKKLAADADRRADRLAEQLRALGVEPSADNP